MTTLAAKIAEAIRAHVQIEASGPAACIAADAGDLKLTGADEAAAAIVKIIEAERSENG